MNKSDVMKDWPADPANEELMRLAQELQGAAPPLEPAALARVQQQMYAELDRAQHRQQRRRWAFGCSIAAAVLLALGGYWHFRPGPQPFKTGDAPDLVLIEDRITVALGEPPTPTSDKPLVRLDENRSLFTD